MSIDIVCTYEKYFPLSAAGLAHWGHANVNIPDSWALEDNVGVFGDFRISRNVTTAEGCTVRRSRYRVDTV